MWLHATVTATTCYCLFSWWTLAVVWLVWVRPSSNCRTSLPNRWNRLVWFSPQPLAWPLSGRWCEVCQWKILSVKLFSVLTLGSVDCCRFWTSLLIKSWWTFCPKRTDVTGQQPTHLMIYFHFLTTLFLTSGSCTDRLMQLESSGRLTLLHWVCNAFIKWPRQAVCATHFITYAVVVVLSLRWWLLCVHVSNVPWSRP